MAQNRISRLAFQDTTNLLRSPVSSVSINGYFRNIEKGCRAVQTRPLNKRKIALTEHCGFRESSGFTEKACAYLFEKYGEEFLVVLGQELNFSISTENRHDGIDLLGLFLTEHIDCGWSSGRDPKVSEFITGASVSGVPNSANWSRGLRPNALAFMLNLRRCSLANRSQRPLQCSRYTRISSSR